VKPRHALRSDAALIWSAALRAVDAEIAVRRVVRRQGRSLRVGQQRFDLPQTRRVWVVGAGKAAAPMGRALEKILGPRLSGGILVTKDGHGLPLQKIELLEASHPLPDARGVVAGGRIAALARDQVRSKDLVFCVLSGGGSALLPAPAPGITLEDKLQCTRLLLNAGATIQEMNAVRKHLSTLKGGGLARLFGRTPVIALILSDVVGDPLDTIASGPLVPDPTTFGDCLDMLKRVFVLDQMPVSVRRRLEAGARGEIPETPKPGDPVFRNVLNWIVGSNAQACSAAARAARRLGYKVMVLTTRLEGDTAEAARFHMSIAEEIVSQGRPLRRPACLLSGGETTVRVTGTGRGGRNQEFALNCAGTLARLAAPCLVASLGTDGTDGPTDAAGAMVDNTTVSRSIKYGARFLAESLRNNDSYEFFKRLGDLIFTGPTRTNVMDLHIVLIG